MEKQRNVAGREIFRLAQREGESCLFLRQRCMSFGSPLYHSAVCNMCSFPVSHSTSILVSFCLQHHGPAMHYPHVLSAALLQSSLMNLLPACTCLHECQWSQSHKSSDTYVFPVKRPDHLPPHTGVWPERVFASVGQAATILRPRSTNAAKGVATGSAFFFEIYS